MSVVTRQELFKHLWYRCFESKIIEVFKVDKKWFHFL